MSDSEDEMSTHITLARHLLSKLSLSEDYTAVKSEDFDRRYPLHDLCPCGLCKENIRRFFGDTSIGKCVVVRWFSVFPLKFVPYNDMQ